MQIPQFRFEIFIAIIDIIESLVGRMYRYNEEYGQVWN